MADKDDFKDRDELMAKAMLRRLLGFDALKITPFKVEIAVTLDSIECRTKGNKKFLEDIEGGTEWFAETSSLIHPIMQAQTDKFFELAKEKFGFEEVGRTNDEFEDFVKTVLGDKTQSTE